MKRVAEHLGPRRFVERRCRHLAEPDLVGDRLRLASPRAVEGRLDLGLLGEGRDRVRRLRPHTRTGRRHATQDDSANVAS